MTIAALCGTGASEESISQSQLQLQALSVELKQGS